MSKIKVNFLVEFDLHDLQYLFFKNNYNQLVVSLKVLSVICYLDTAFW